MEEKLFEITIPMAKFKRKGKEQLVTLNNTSKWFRYGVTKIKNEYKNLLKEFFISSNPNPPYKELIITYRILRDSKRKLDSDNIIWNIKWFTDVLTETNWLVDDDKVTFTIFPTEYVKDTKETSIKVTVKTKTAPQSSG